LAKQAEGAVSSESMVNGSFQLDASSSHWLRLQRRHTTLQIPRVSFSCVSVF